MKRKFILWAALPLMIAACNNETKDSVERADSINEVKTDSTDNMPPAITADKESTDFLVNAANAGMTEVNLGQMGQQKAMHARVKSFAGMIANDHVAANNEVKKLAAQRNITLPTTPGEAKQKTMDGLVKKTGTDFDKSLMKTFIDEHQEAIDLFEKASNRVNDSEIKNFADNTLPKLKMHLDSAKAIHKLLR